MSKRKPSTDFYQAAKEVHTGQKEAERLILSDLPPAESLSPDEALFHCVELCLNCWELVDSSLLRLRDEFGYDLTSRPFTFVPPEFAGLYALKWVLLKSIRHQTSFQPTRDDWRFAWSQAAEISFYLLLRRLLEQLELNTRPEDSPERQIENYRSARETILRFNSDRRAVVNIATLKGKKHRAQEIFTGSQSAIFSLCFTGHGKDGRPFHGARWRDALRESEYHPEGDTQSSSVSQMFQAKLNLLSELYGEQPALPMPPGDLGRLFADPLEMYACTLINDAFEELAPEEVDALPWDIRITLTRTFREYFPKFIRLVPTIDTDPGAWLATKREAGKRLNRAARVQRAQQIEADLSPSGRIMPASVNRFLMARSEIGGLRPKYHLTR